MKCSPKTMIVVALGLAAAAGFAYLAIPAAQAFILASAPTLLALVCPISMVAMMWGMRGGGANTACGAKSEQPPSGQSPAKQLSDSPRNAKVGAGT